MSRTVLLAFALIFSLFGALVLAQPACPTCHGTGHMSNIPGLEKLQLIGFDTTVKYEFVGCDLWVVYDITVNAMMANDSPIPVEGPLLVSIRDNETGTMYCEKVTFFEVPANAASHTVLGKVDFSIYLEGLPGIPVLDIDVSLPKGEKIVCPSCGGGCNLPLLIWLLVYLGLLG